MSRIFDDLGGGGQAAVKGLYSLSNHCYAYGDSCVTQVTQSNSADDLRLAADTLANLAIDHYHDFKQFRTIYYESPERIDILNATAPGFFADLHKWLLDRIVLNVRKILDPSTSGSKNNLKANLTVAPLHERALANQKYPAAEAVRLIDELKRLAAHVEAWRHQLVAHIDAEAALGSSKAQYTVIPSEIAEFYSTLDRYFDLVYCSLWDTVFPIDAISHSDANELMLACRRSAVLSELLENDVMAYDALMRGSRFGGQ